ncbi:ATP-dependent helicase [Butyricicoccus sp. Marseille-Q5471]|uniref:ATP-dependent helicase n=1 Tax=Butyricicoccus sp. Marseille-Q5471 TaxID=3039493 RepID=UPI0024BD2482|nr:UvrD-helicase domain-containing protein [Butyricicoccus sp. Marseille-Q5471]
MEPTKFDLKYAAVRRAIIEQRFAHLNDMQREAVFSTDGPLLILAGAGSGKTTVLINRITAILRYGQGLTSQFAPAGATEEELLFLTQYLTDPQEEQRERAELLCSMQPVKPWEIIAITFTNKAARELRERLTLAVGEEDAGAIWAHTFHTACLRILRRHVDLLGFEKAFTIYDEDDKKRVIIGILRQLNLDEKIYDPRMVMGQISRAKDKLMTPKQFRVDAHGDYVREKVADVYERYEKEMKKACALDFDDIIMKTVLLLQQNPDVLEYYQHKFRYVLVDEYQDTNHAQYVLSSLLAGYYENICVVGDDDQSIYKFRGATITNILEFEKQFQDAKTIRLEQNYRSTGNILNAANELIRNNAQRKGKELWTDQQGGAKIKLHRSDNQDSEAAYIADTIVEGVREGHKWGDFAILYRNNVLSNNIVSAFIRNAIPYRIYKGRDFFSRAEIKDMFAYLWVIENPADELRLRRIINVPARKIGDRSVETASQIALDEGVLLYDVVRNASQYPALSRGAGAMEKFGQMIENLRQQREFLSLTELYDALLESSGYVSALMAKNDMESKGRLEHIEELKSNIVEYEERTETPTLANFLEEMALYTDADHTGEEEDAVVMMTMHSAKGLEFPVVFLAGMEDGLFPGFRASERDEDMEEERRLCYVAVTRAREQLYLTCAERRMLYGRTQYARPSRFIEEMPSELFDSNVSAEQLRPPVEDKPCQLGIESARSFSAAQPPKPRAAAAATAAAAPDFPVGCRVSHRAFGEGMVTSSKPMGGDSLLEIAFDQKGTKRLMAKSAAQFMERI